LFFHIRKQVQRSRNKVSQANKELKTLCAIGALSAIKMKGESHGYFKRKVASGKNKKERSNPCGTCPK